MYCLFENSYTRLLCFFPFFMDLCYTKNKEEKIMELMTRINEAIAYLQKHLEIQPEIAIILGSGLGPLGNEIENPQIFDYANIPHFPVSTVPGHAGKLIAGTLSGRKVLVMQGRFHYYEGHKMDIVTLPIRVFARLGIRYLFVTNAAGGIKEGLNPALCFISQIKRYCSTSNLCFSMQR